MKTIQNILITALLFNFTVFSQTPNDKKEENLVGKEEKKEDINKEKITKEKDTLEKAKLEKKELKTEKK